MKYRLTLIHKTVRRNLIPLLQAGLDLLYPVRCAACASPLPSPAKPGFCNPCQEQLKPVLAPACQICSEPFPGKLPEEFTCPNCHGLPFAFDFAISAWHSSGPLREAIHHFKYGRQLCLRLPLSEYLAACFQDPRLQRILQTSGNGSSTTLPTGSASLPTTQDWLVVPVPLHPRRFRERRFNQSYELAHLLAKSLSLPFADLLRRNRYTTSQAALSRSERLANLAGAFQIQRKTPLPLPHGIFLIDDVFTTGSTAHACARILRQAGATTIIVLTLARG